MPPKARGKAKAFSNSSKSNTSASEPPSPFIRAPPNLEPLLSTLDTKHVYITSVDTKPQEFKAKIFAVPAAMNIIIVALLLWRIRMIAPYYLKIFTTALGYSSETTRDVDSMNWNQTRSEVLTRAFNGIFDMLLWVFIWPWPRDFFISQADGSPVLWRTAIGFRHKEVTIRRSRRWDQKIGNVAMGGGEATAGGSLFLTNVRQATSWSYMRDRTGYLMMNKDWELDWRAMTIATEMVDTKEMSLVDFEMKILVFSEDFGWLLFETEDMKDDSREQEGRQKILAFKDELTTLGKESLFFRWIELIQFESTQPGGFTPDRQAHAMRMAKEMFEAQGVDFEKFWEKIGGMEGMPGMDQVQK